jgi:DNA-binding transcriptional regulator YhcF (GntR family)/DNA-binding LacI/PurR family transcriptional regulator
MTEHTPTILKALEQLKGIIEKSRQVGKNRLPGIRALSEACGISRPTIGKALAILAQEQSIEITPRRGILISGAENPVKQPLYRNKWERVAGLIQRDILNGVYAPGSRITSFKELSQRYGTSYRSILKALSSLAQQGIILPDKTYYRIKVPSVSTSRSTVILLGKGSVMREFMTRAPQEKEFLIVFENGCRTINADQTRVGVWTEADPVQLFHNGKPFHFSSLTQPVLGAVLLEVGIPEIDQQVRRQLENWHCPVAVVTSNMGSALQTRHRFEMIYSTDFGNIRGSQNVAQELYALGHRHIGFISPFHRNLWSQNQSMFLAQALAAIDPHTSVDNFVYSDFYTMWEMIYATTRWTRESLLQEISTPPANHTQSDEPLFCSGRMQHYRIYTIATTEFERYCHPLLKAALDNTHITAWVTAAHETATLAFDFLEARGVGVPDRLSLISLMNTWEMVNRQIDSYNYNIPALVNAVINHITHPLQSFTNTPKNPVCIDGGIVRRKTIGRAHSQS